MCIVSITTLAQNPPMDDFVEAIERYDKIIRTIDHTNKSYDELSQTIGKVFGMSLWAYGIYKGLNTDDMSKIPMATVSGLAFGLSVTAASKMVVDCTNYFKSLYRLYCQEQNIRTLASLLKLRSKDLAQIDVTSYDIQTRQLILELQLELPIDQAPCNQ